MNEFDDRMKAYEGVEARRRFMPLLPILIRLDGKCFHNFTKGLERPYDSRFRTLMADTTRFLMEETGARLGYTQSDEISLVLYSDTYASQVFFDGRIQKLVSVLASMCGVFFTSKVGALIEEKKGQLAFFDCRAWQVPNKTEAANYIVWREQDATRNSISMAAQSFFSTNELHKKSCKQMQEMMMTEKGHNWDKYPAYHKRGVYLRRVKTSRKYTPDELELLNENHDARKNPDLIVERSEIVQDEIPPIAKVINRESVIFDGAVPETVED